VATAASATKLRIAMPAMAAQREGLGVAGRGDGWGAGADWGALGRSGTSGGVKMRRASPVVV